MIADTRYSFVKYKAIIVLRTKKRIQNLQLIFTLFLCVYFCKFIVS